MGGLIEQVIKEMKAHPVTLVLVLISLGAVSTGYSKWAKASDVTILAANIESQAKINTCRWLSDKIDTLETDIYVLERDGADSKWINEKKIELAKLKSRYRQTTCSTTGY